jgi:hypothetical protein
VKSLFNFKNKFLFGFSLLFVVGCEIALIWILLFSSRYSSVEGQVDQFVKSPEMKVPADVLFPWQWDYMCVIGDYADFEIFKKDMGRPTTFKERLMWIRYGEKGESELNLVFEVNNEIVNIERYLTIARPTLNMRSSPERGKCIGRRQGIIFVKQFSEFDERRVRDLIAITTN